MNTSGASFITCPLRALLACPPAASARMDATSAEPPMVVLTSYYHALSHDPVAPSQADGESITTHGSQHGSHASLSFMIQSELCQAMNFLK